MERMIGLTEAERLTGTRYADLKRAIERGSLKATKKGAGSRARFSIPESELKRFVMEHAPLPLHSGAGSMHIENEFLSSTVTNFVAMAGGAGDWIWVQAYGDLSISPDWDPDVEGSWIPEHPVLAEQQRVLGYWPHDEQRVLQGFKVRFVRAYLLPRESYERLLDEGVPMDVVAEMTLTEDDVAEAWAEHEAKRKSR